ncbi:MAG: hypothetical protein IH627_18740, partial [Rubrivivax sp.]|nr:hypothetical protein [Rubrivivax sp.]
GQLLLDGGAHGGRQLIPRPWVERLTEPCPVAPFYGRLVWLNRDGKTFPGASERSFFMLGAGGHYVWVEPACDAVIVLRWLDGAAAPEVMRCIRQALTAGAAATAVDSRHRDRSSWPDER